MGTWYVDNVLGSDTNAGTAPGAGNAFATIQKGLDQLTANDGSIVYVKGNSGYSAGATQSIISGTPNYQSQTRVVGYTTTPGDGGSVTIQATANSIVLLKGNANGAGSFENFICDANGHTSVTGFYGSNYASNTAFNCKAIGCAIGFDLSSSPAYNGVSFCEADSCAIGVQAGVSASVENCYIHDCTNVGISCSSMCVIGRCIIAGCVNYGIFCSYATVITNCVIDGITSGPGIYRSDNYIGIVTDISYNIISRCGTYGVEFQSSAASNYQPRFRHNRFYSNTSGNTRYGLTGVDNTALSGLPFAGSGDYSLNNTAGAGADCRAIVDTFFGKSSYIDAGAYQHQDSGGGGGGSTMKSFVG